MENNKFKVIIRGGYGLTNFGDDALLKSIHEDYFSDFSNSELAYSCTNEEYLEKYIPGFSVLPLNSNYSDQCDVLIYGGGTQFYSFNRKRNSLKTKILNNLKHVKNPFIILKKIYNLISRNFINKKSINSPFLKMMAVGIGVGPFLPEADPKVEENVKNLFKSMEFVAVRDIYSYNKCKEWGVKNFDLYADLCFKMTHPLFFQQNNNEAISNLGIIVRDWNHTKEGGSFRDSLLQFISKVEKENIKVHFFVFAKKSDALWLEFLKENKRQCEMWNPDTDVFDDYLVKLNEMDAFITARYHGAIFSSMLGKPFITVEVEQKLKMISDIFSIGSQNWSYPFDTLELYNKFLEIDSEYKNNSTAIITSAKRQNKLAIKMYDDLQIKLKTFI